MGRASSDAFATPRELESMESSLKEAAMKHGEVVKKRCDKHGIQSRTILTAGHLVEAIVNEAERSKADLIVMGSHGRSALAAAVLGSGT